MTFTQGLGLFIAAYLVLLARSAAKQGELPQFLRSMAVVGLLFLTLAAVTAAYLWLAGS